MARYLLFNPDTNGRADQALSPRSISALGRQIGAAAPLAAVEIAHALRQPLVLLATDPRHADLLEAEIRWFAGPDLPVVHFVEWETLPYDSFSPHQDIVSQRLQVLASLGKMREGIVIVSSPSLLQRLPPVDYVAARTLMLQQGQSIDRQEFTDALIACGYLRIPQVTEHGEFAVRGSLLDVFPMGSTTPIRIDFFDDEIESLRQFDPESQLSGEKIESIRILPAREIPLDESDVKDFRHRYRERFEGQPSRSRVYREISDGIAHGGIEYYLPLFFDTTANFFDYLPSDSVILAPTDLRSILEQSWQEIGERYELYSLDPERPVLRPHESFFSPADTEKKLASFHRIEFSGHSLKESAGTINLPTRIPPALKIESRYEDAAASLMQFLNSFDGRVLFTADSAGRRESVFDLLSGRGLDTRHPE